MCMHLQNHTLQQSSLWVYPSSPTTLIPYLSIFFAWLVPAVKKHLCLCLALLQAKCKEEDYWTVLPKCVKHNDNKHTVTLTYGEISVNIIYNIIIYYYIILVNLTWLSYLALLTKSVKLSNWQSECDATAAHVKINGLEKQIVIDYLKSGQRNGWML